MDFASGGILSTYIKHIHLDLDYSNQIEKIIELWAAEIIVALKYLHSLGIVYRELKPDNIHIG
jgi:serine/threonine protein kinase